MEETKTKKIKLPSTTVTGILWLVLGIILLVYPGESLDMMCRIAGILILIAGIAQIIVGWTAFGAIGAPFSLTTGIIIGLVGLFFIIRPDILVSILPFIAGIILIIHGATGFAQSFQLAGAKYRYWWLGLLLSAISMIFGVILFFNAHATAAFIARIIGIFLIYSGVSGLWIGSRKAKAAKERKLEEDALDVDAKITDAD